jgi:quinoprotein glucose dehydrogenase
MANQNFASRTTSVSDDDIARPLGRFAIANMVLSFTLMLIGVGFLAGGARLIFLGGSYYFVFAGLAFSIDAILLFYRSRWSYLLFAALVLSTLAWAVDEVGLDWWQLFPRGNLIAVIALILIAPWTVRRLRPPIKDKIFSLGYASLALALAACATVALISILRSPDDLSGTLSLNRQSVPVATEFRADKDWSAYGGGAAGTRYSILDQINTQNVHQLQVAWTFHTGDLQGEGDPVETTYEVTPLKIDDTVYLCTPHDLVFALDPETGREKWRFDPKIQGSPFQNTQHLTCRGLSYFDGRESKEKPPINADCQRRIFLPTVDGRLIALNAQTGEICREFGAGGSVDLWQNMPNVARGSYYSTSPPVVTRELIIVGGAINDNVSVHNTSGVIRAYSARTGRLVWNWDSRNPTETKPILPNVSYNENSPNSWSISSYDPKLGLVFVPIGNQSPDQFGGNRDANVEKYSSSVVALREDTGQVAWVFQATHHDLWDMDIPSQPSLVDLDIRGERIPALVQPTKQGEIFVLDRRSGAPILPVSEQTAPHGAAKGDFTAPTQPVSVLSFNPPELSEGSMWGLSPFDLLACRIKFRSLKYDGRYTPPSVQGSIIYPGNVGVFNWGGVAVDPERQIVFAMPVQMAFVSTLVVRNDPNSRLVTRYADPPFNENFGAPYAVKMVPFLSPLGKPCQAPPWGYVAGADIAEGRIAYRHVNGTVRDLSKIPLPLKLGVPGIGGPIVTHGGVAFLSGTLDYFLRAYDVTTGDQLWEHRLPAGAQATPMTYWSEASGRQFVVVVAGGHGTLGTKRGDSIIAYALPKR